VSLAKIALPLIALALVMVLVAWPQAQNEDTTFQVSLAALPEGDAGDAAMTRARFVGTDAKDQVFVITAERAVPNAINPERIRLETLQADLTLNSGAWVSMLSVTGLYDRTQQSLTLLDGVDFFADNGFALHTASALIDLADGTAQGSEAVRAQGPMGELDADSFRMEREGQRLFFKGNVRMTLQPGNAL
jgi:lipopolysaccharide export system protein LptC